MKDRFHRPDRTTEAAKPGSAPPRFGHDRSYGVELPPQATLLLRMQQAAGNAGVVQMMRKFRPVGKESGGRSRSDAPTGSVIQGKFAYSKESGLFIDEDTGLAYRLFGSIGYGGEGRRAYQLQGDYEDVLVDQQTMEAVQRFPYSGAPQASSSGDGVPMDEEKDEGKMTDENSTQTSSSSVGLDTTSTSESGEKKRKREVEDDSEFSESDDDATKELSAEERLEILMRKGRRKKKNLVKRNLKKKGDKFEMHDPRSRKVLIAHRQSKESKLSLISNQEYVWVGDQVVRLGDGTGYFIQPGGNEREEGIAEPPAEYNLLFQQMRNMGADKNAKALYKLATGKDREDKATFSDPELAAMALYYINNDASAIAAELGSRSQLVEHLGKFAAITGMSEFARSMEAKRAKEEKSGPEKKKRKTTARPAEEEAPYDATLFVKQGLMKVIDGKITLQQLFYQGKGGEDSIFLGAPSEKHSSKKLGGAEILRHPFQYEENLRRQMDIFPTNKKEFKQALNKLKSQAEVELPETKEEDLKKAEEAVAREQIAAAEQLLRRIRGAEIPEARLINDFLNASHGAIKKFNKEINRLEKLFQGNEQALLKIQEAKAALKKKKDEALKKL